MRDVVARLLAYVASHDEEPEEILKHFHEAGDYWVDKKPPPNERTLKVAETIRREKDWIVEAARVMMGLDKT